MTESNRHVGDRRVSGFPVGFPVSFNKDTNAIGAGAILVASVTSMTSLEAGGLGFTGVWLPYTNWEENAHPVHHRPLVPGLESVGLRLCANGSLQSVFLSGRVSLSTQWNYVCESSVLLHGYNVSGSFFFFFLSREVLWCANHTLFIHSSTEDHFGLVPDCQKPFIRRCALH